MKTNDSENKNIQSFSNSKSLTPEQKYFYRAKKMLGHFDEIELKRDLTLEEKREINLIKEELWAKIYKYAKSLSAASLQGFSKPVGYMDDLIQSISIKFFSHLNDYNPLISTPTTFFTPYFREAINDYKFRDLLKLTANDANNIRKVSKAIRELEMQNEKYDITILTIMTGLSYKVVKKTLEVMNNAGYVALDEAFNVQSKEPSPEDSYIEQESSNMLYSEIDRLLTDEEKKILFSKVDVNSNKDKNYKELSRILNMPEHEIKTKWNRIVQTLANSPVLKILNPCINRDDINVSTQSNASDTMENDMLNELSD